MTPEKSIESPFAKAGFEDWKWYGIHRFGYGVWKANLQYTPDKPYGSITMLHTQFSVWQGQTPSPAQSLHPTIPLPPLPFLPHSMDTMTHTVHFNTRLMLSALGLVFSLAKPTPFPT